MPRRAYFVFHRRCVGAMTIAPQTSFNAPKGLFCISPMSRIIYKSREPHGMVSMPRRACFVFHQVFGTTLQNMFVAFQCPEGLILYFTGQIGRYSSRQSMRFNAPKGLFCISPFNYIREDRRHMLAFQCPEGLILYFTVTSLMTLSLFPSRVSMPRRAYFVFHRIYYRKDTML